MHKSTFFLTWTTYGTWLPGDERGWHHHNKGEQLANSRLKQWCSNQMRTGEVVLALFDRVIVEDACRAHCVYRNWHLHAVNARSNHVHAIVTADTTGKKLLNELKANCTGRLRQHSPSRFEGRVWTRGGYIDVVDDDDELEQLMIYVIEGQNRKMM